MKTVMQNVMNAGKFLWNRMQGANYGCVRYGNNPIKLVETGKLSELVDNICQDYGAERFRHIDFRMFEDIASRVGKIAKGEARVSPNSAIRYDQSHGYTALSDYTSINPAISIHEKLSSPILSYLKSLF